MGWFNHQLVVEYEPKGLLFLGQTYFLYYIYKCDTVILFGSTGFVVTFGYRVCCNRRNPLDIVVPTNQPV